MDFLKKSFLLSLYAIYAYIQIFASVHLDIKDVLMFKKSWFICYMELLVLSQPMKGSI